MADSDAGTLNAPAAELKELATAMRETGVRYVQLDYVRPLGRMAIIVCEMGAEPLPPQPQATVAGPGSGTSDTMGSITFTPEELERLQFAHTEGFPVFVKDAEAPRSILIETPDP